MLSRWPVPSGVTASTPWAPRSWSSSSGRRGGTPPMAKVAIVTGSDSGIGKAAAVVLAERGFDVGITWHTDEEGAKGTAEEVSAAGPRAEVRRLDLSDPTSGPA